MHDFGEQLRSLRRRRGLSQAELGAGQYSASYISHLESGRRQPSPELVAFLAGRLEVAGEELTGVAPQAYADATGAALATLAELRILEARDVHDHRRAAQAADRFLLPSTREQADPWWAATYVKAEALLAAEDYAACRMSVTALLDHPLTALSPGLRARALVVGSRALRADGALGPAREQATAAVRAALDSGEAEQVVGALRVEVAACAELGLVEEATELAERLVRARARLEPGHLTGLAAWTVGNVAFLRHDIEEGVREHTQAAQQLRPAVDLRAWARFHKASAAMRLAAGTTEAVDTLIEAAGHALALVGNTSDRAELELLKAERVVDADPERARALVEDALASTALPAHTRGEAHVLRARAHTSAGDPEAARRALVEAAQAFESAGADRRASEIWRQLAGVGERA